MRRCFLEELRRKKFDSGDRISVNEWALLQMFGNFLGLAVKNAGKELHGQVLNKQISQPSRVGVFAERGLRIKSTMLCSKEE